MLLLKLMLWLYSLQLAERGLLNSMQQGPQRCTVFWPLCENIHCNEASGPCIFGFPLAAARSCAMCSYESVSNVVPHVK